MKQLFLVLLLWCLCSCQKQTPPKDTVTVPNLFGEGKVTYRYDKLTPFLWAYCLDMVKRTDQEKTAWEEFDKACKKDEKLFGQVAHHFEIKGMIDRAKR